jgi:large subunit ribosomal protein L10
VRAEKHSIIEELKARIGGASAIIFTSYTGASAEKMATLRRALDGHKGGYLVVKNRLFALAAKQAGLGDELPGFDGQVGVALSDEDSSVAVLKALVEFNKQHETVGLLGGFVGGRPYTAAQLKELSKLPTKPVLQAQLLGALQAVPRGLVTVLAGRLRSPLYLINAYIEKRGGVPKEAAAPEAAAPEAAAPEAAALEAAAPEAAAPEAAAPETEVPETGATEPQSGTPAEEAGSN